MLEGKPDESRLLSNPVHPRFRLMAAAAFALPLVFLAWMGFEGAMTIQAFCPSDSPGACQKAGYFVLSISVLPALALAAVGVIAFLRERASLLLAIATFEAALLALGILIGEGAATRYSWTIALFLLAPQPWPFLAISIAGALYGARKLGATQLWAIRLAGVSGAIATIAVVVVSIIAIVPMGNLPESNSSAESLQRSFAFEIVQEQFFGFICYILIPLAAWWPIPAKRDEWGDLSGQSPPRA